MKDKRFFLFANPEKPDTVEMVSTLTQQLAGKGCQAILDGWLYDRLRVGERCDISQLAPGDVDVIIALGGDGTLLRTLSTSARLSIPVLGINMGRMGFLLEIEPEEAEDAIDRILSGQYHEEERMMLSVQVNGSMTAFAANELAVTRGGNPSSLTINVATVNENVFCIHGDGVLVSTPTGTTGYALSAGSPVVYPLLPCLIVTPVCSHIMHHRPVILPDDQVITIEVKNTRGYPHQVCIDGQEVFDMKEDSKVRVCKSEKNAHFIRFKPQKFLTRLNQKQMQWSNYC